MMPKTRDMAKTETFVKQSTIVAAALYTQRASVGPINLQNLP